MEDYPLEILVPASPVAMCFSHDPARVHELIVSNLSSLPVKAPASPSPSPSAPSSSPSLRAPSFRVVNAGFGASVISGRERAVSRDTAQRAKGIFKSEWILRHYHEIPSVLILVLDWPELSTYLATITPASSSPAAAVTANPLSSFSSLKTNELLEHWRQNGEKELVKILDSVLQASRRPRVPLEVIAVLLQKESAPVTSQIGTDFRLSTLFKFIEPKNCVSFNPEDIDAAIKRLERAVLKRSAEYYNDEVNELKMQIKSGVDGDNFRFISRHHIKVGFLFEMAGAPKKSLKHYAKAFSLLTDNKFGKDEIEEFKIVCDVVNFKLCRWYLEKGDVERALQQFQRHIAFFRNMVQDPELIGVHHAWVAQQYLVMAQLLEIYPTSETSLSTSVSSTTSARNTPNRDLKGSHSAVPPVPEVTPSAFNLAAFPPKSPGYYFEAAANALIRRRVAAEPLIESLRNDLVLKQVLPKVKPMTFVHLDPRMSVYLGQKLFRTSVAVTSDSDELLHLNFGKAQVAAAQELAQATRAIPKHPPLSELIVELLIKARDYYAVFLNALSSALSLSQSDDLSASTTASTSAKRAVALIECTLASEYLAAKHFDLALAEVEKHIALYMTEQWWPLAGHLAEVGLACALQGSDPALTLKYYTTLLLRELELPVAKRAQLYSDLQSYLSALPASDSPVIVAQAQRPSCIRVQIEFASETLSPNVESAVTFHLTSHFPQPLPIAALTAAFSNRSDFGESKDLVIQSDAATLASGKALRIRCKLTPPLIGVLQCVSVRIPLAPSVFLEWRPNDAWASQTLSIRKDPRAIAERTSVEVIDASVKLEVTALFEGPAFVGELFPVKLRFRNLSSTPLTKIHTTSSLQGAEEGLEKDELLVQSGDKFIAVPVEVIIADIAPSSAKETTVFVRVKQIIGDSAKRSIVVKTQFQSSFRPASLATEVALTVKPPFDISASVFNSLSLGTLLWSSRSSRDTTPQMTESPLILQSGESLDAALTLTSRSELPFHFSDISLQMNLSAENLPIATVTSPPLPAEGLDLSVAASWSHWFRIKPLNAGLIHLGVFSLSWKRAESKAGLEYPRNAVTLVLPIVDTMLRDFSARFDSADVGYVGVPLPVSFVVANRSAFSTAFHIKVSDSNAFLLAGDKFATFTVAPHSEYVLPYTVVALQSGRLALPKFTLSTAGGGVGAAMQNWMISPQHFVFVKPELTRTKLI